MLASSAMGGARIGDRRHATGSPAEMWCPWNAPGSDGDTVPQRDDELQGEMRDVRQGLTEKLDGCRDELRACIARSHQDLLELIRANHAQMLTLHEHLIERITLIGEGRQPKVPEPSSGQTQ